MSQIWPDRTASTTTGNGTGPFVVTGTIDGYLPIPDVDGLIVGDTFKGAIYAVDAHSVPTGQYVTGEFTYSAPNTITVTTVEGPVPDVPVDFTTGTKWIILCPTGTDFAAWQDAVGGDFLSAADIGVTVQAYSANLSEYAAVNPTTAGLALLDDADAAAQRATLGVYSTTQVDTADATTLSDAETYTDAAIAAIAGSGTGTLPNGVVSGLGTVYTGTGLQWAMSAGSANINGDLVTASAQTVTLTAAHATLPRIDVLYLDDTGTFGKIDGTAATNPSTPNVDPTSQLYLAYVLVPATATDLTAGITTEVIYDEGTEWTATTSGSGFTAGSTNNPNAGTKCIEGTTVSAGAYVKFVDGTPTTFDGDGNLVIGIRSKASWNAKRSLTLQWYTSSVTKGSPVTIKEGSFGFASATTGAYQTLVIAKSLFSVPAGTIPDELRITAAGTGGTFGFYIDPIKLQTVASGSGGTGGGGTSSGITQDAADARYVKLTGSTMSGGLGVPDSAYGVGWNGSLLVPTRNAVYDKIEAIVAGIPGTFTTEDAQDATGAMVDTTLEYVDATPLLRRAALTGHITASAGSNATVLGSFTKAQLDTAVSDGNVLYVGDVTQYTNEDAQDAVGTISSGTGLATVTYTDGSNTLVTNVPAAVASDINTGTDTSKALTADALAGSKLGTATITLLVSDPAGSAITTGDGKAYWRVPSTIGGMDLVSVAAAVTTVSSSGIPTVQIANVTQAADMLTTKLTIDASETDSSTAATAAVIDTGNDDVATGDMLRVDIDVAGTGAKGLMVEMQFRLP